MDKTTVYNTCCLIKMKEYPDKYFDLAVVDPPYGINAQSMQMGQTNKRKHSTGHVSGFDSTAVRLRKDRLTSGGGKLKGRNLNNADINWDNKIPDPEYFEELFRISKNQIIWGGNYFPLPPTRCMVVWDKMQAWDTFSQVEIAWTSFDKPAKIFKFATTGETHLGQKIHPTQKPVKLYEFIYHHFSKPGMKIIDTHLGSGTNRVAALKFDLEFVGIEKDEKYFQDHEAYFKIQAKKTLLQRGQMKLL